MGRSAYGIFRNGTRHQSTRLRNRLKLQVPAANGIDQSLREHRHPRPHLTRAGTLKTINSDKYRILLGQLGGDEGLLGRVIAGEAVVSIAMHDIAAQPSQWVAGGLVAEAVIARNGNDVVLVSVPENARVAEENLASTPMAELDLDSLETVLLASGADALATLNRADFGIDAGKAYGFNMSVTLRIQVEAVATP